MSHPDQGLRFHGDIVAGPGHDRGGCPPRPPPEEVVLLNGAAEAFWLLAQVLRPQQAVVVAPSFTEPEAALQATGRRVQHVWRDPDHFHLDPAAVSAEADPVVTGNPNNPTGTLDPAATLAGLARPGRVLVVDEAFMELTPGETESLAGRRDLPGLVVVRSLTKLWGLAGIRAGYLLASPAIASAVRTIRQPWSVNSLACAALSAWARQPTDHAAHQIQQLAATRERLALGRQFSPAAGPERSGRPPAARRPRHRRATLPQLPRPHRRPPPGRRPRPGRQPTPPRRPGRGA